MAVQKGHDIDTVIRDNVTEANFEAESVTFLIKPLKPFGFLVRYPNTGFYQLMGSTCRLLY